MTGSAVNDQPERIFERAQALFESGDFDEAATTLREMIVLAPESMAAHNMLGNVLYEQGRAEEAERAYRTAVELEPESAEAHYNLANAMYAGGELAGALEEYEASIRLGSRNAAVHYNRGNALYYLGRIDEAIVSYLRAIEFDPSDHAGQFNLANALVDAGCLGEALRRYRLVTEMAPEFVDGHSRLGRLLYRVGEYDEALAVTEAAIAIHPDPAAESVFLCRILMQAGRLDDARTRLETLAVQAPNDPFITHMLASCHGDCPPPRASDAYVRGLFDEFADSFDANLRNLGYRAPALVAGALSAAAESPHMALEILDAGCGTGLCGPLLRPLASRLVGLDLSPGMLEKARDTESYDELIEAELIGHLAETSSRFDAIVAADSLVYVGDLLPFLQGATRVLKPGGLLVMTLEHLQDDPDEARGYWLHPHGRYAHTESHVAAGTEAAGLVLRSIELVEVRMEAGAPVAGMLVVADRHR